MDTSNPATDRITTARRLRAEGVSRSLVERRCAAGRWRRLLPGVLLLSRGSPTRPELLRAALLYAGSGAIVTGRDAMAAAGIRVAPVDDTVHLLLPAARRVHDTAFVRCERTTRLPEPDRVRGIPFAPPVRATLDAARRVNDRQQLVALLTPAVGSGRCPMPQLTVELDAGSQRGSAPPRAVLAELHRGLRAAQRHRALRIVTAAGIPEPAWDATVRDDAGTTLGALDAYWEDARLAWDYGSAHSRDGGALAGRRDALLAARGVAVLRTHPTQLRDDARAVRDRLAASYRRGAASA